MVFTVRCGNCSKISKIAYSIKKNADKISKGSSKEFADCVKQGHHVYIVKR